MKLLDREVPQPQAIVTLDIARSPNPLRRRLRLRPHPAAQLEGDGQPGRLRPTHSRNPGQFGPWTSRQSPERAVPPRQDRRGHGQCVLPASPCSQENGQKLLRRQRAGADRPETLARPVVFDVLGETKRHWSRLVTTHGATYPFLRDGSLTATGL